MLGNFKFLQICGQAARRMKERRGGGLQRERERERAGVNSFREQLVVQTGPTVVCRTDVQPLLAVSV